jgi:tetratricopeptide (TPR) repeat protein
MLAAVTVAPLAHAESFRAEDPEAKKDYLDRISKGELAYMAKDLSGATAGFQDAIKTDPSRLLAYYRLGELQMVESKYDDALASLNTALTKKGNNALKGKVMFIIGLVGERAHKLPDAKAAFAKYIDFLSSNPDAKGHPQIAAQHIKVIEKRMKDEVDYGKVKERIIARQKENEAKAIENAKQDSQNK